MNFGFHEIDGEEVGLLVTYAYHPDFRINVEIMKARDSLIIDHNVWAMHYCVIFMRTARTSLIKTMVHPVYVFHTKQGNQCDAFQGDTVCWKLLKTNSASSMSSFGRFFNSYSGCFISSYIYHFICHISYGPYNMHLETQS